MGETLNAIRNRPRFLLNTTLSPEEFTEKLKESLLNEKENFKGKISNQESHIEVRTKERPVWKPRLTLRAEVDGGEGTVIRGIFGPDSSVWTMFMFIYIIFGTMVVIFGSLYYSVRLVGSYNDEDYYWAGSATIFCFCIIIITYILAKIGQSKSKGEMKKLRNFAEEVVLKYEKKT